MAIGDEPREPVERRSWNLATRCLQAYLLARAEEDGTLLKRCASPYELEACLGVHPEEAELVRAAIGSLLQEGFLCWEGGPGRPGWLGVGRCQGVGENKDGQVR